MAGAEKANADIKVIPPKIGQIILDKYVVGRMLGEGGFGAVFEVDDKSRNNKYAMKVELEKQDENEPGLDLEGAVLKKLQGYPHILQYVDEGIWGPQKACFLVMQLAGKSLQSLRQSSPNKQFSSSTVFQVALQTLEAIEIVHVQGLLHRDVKPGNFAIGRESQKRTIFILDFGLVRKFITKSGQVRPQRKSAGFRGSIQYASINAHNNVDLGRVDDLWCWLYTLIQIRTGKLPWRHLSGKKNVGAMKMSMKKEELLKGMEKQYSEIFDDIAILKYADEPPYSKIKTRFKNLMDENKFTLNDQFDWDTKRKVVQVKKSVKEETKVEIVPATKANEETKEEKVKREKSVQITIQQEKSKIEDVKNEKKALAVEQKVVNVVESSSKKTILIIDTQSSSTSSNAKTAETFQMKPDATKNQQNHPAVPNVEKATVNENVKKDK